MKTGVSPSTGRRLSVDDDLRRVAIDHDLDEVVGWHVAKRGDRWAALKPIRQGVGHAFRASGKEIARGLKICCVGEPECNGVREG